MERIRQEGSKAKPEHNGWHYLSLGFLLFPFFPLLGPEASVLDWGVSLVAVLVFVPVYLQAYGATGRPLLTYTLIMVGMGLLMLPFNPWMTGSFIIYAAACIGDLEPPQAAQRMVAFFALVCAAAALFTGSSWTERAITGLLWVFFCLIAGFSSLQGAERRRYARWLEQAQKENVRLAAIAERERIARDLHDLLGHTLSVITLKAELATKLIVRDPARAALEMRDVERISREATQQVREAVQGYKPRGLSGELAGVKLALEAAGILLDPHIESVRLSPAQESVLALALREAVTNVIRHSGARHCTVQLVGERDGLRLVVQDDGKGGQLHEGSGLAGMRARVEALGGTLALVNANGCTLTLHLPFPAQLEGSQSPIAHLSIPAPASPEPQ
ncbi:sensor histidine kinase [Meiothermus granaticius]|uniref:Sensor histidine kinase DesK n=1 Tax=Meiothermus granaticius NBRC 107808 TaxID=1227551 RepID=A0A399F5H6_9DEIN|nr:sensor histidine kinase [Meiothermus granaticius]RIH90906.1 Sensor histidine kinase DesK [Meiothermus granaticius NBRC 107808]GEM87389.1 two-component sensor histidine kinase [Meiothermus granaticius NBRC 107808]